MKFALIPMFIMGWCGICLGQTSEQTTQFILKGQVTNYPDKNFMLVFRKADDSYSIDSLPLKADGSFYLKTTKVDKAIKASISYGNQSVTDLFIAPGYDLTLEMNFQNNNIFSKRISGKGAEANQYLVKRDSISSCNTDVREWWELNEKELLAFIRKDTRLKDSLFKAVFSAKPAGDKSFDYFKTFVRYENLFLTLNYLLVHVNDSNNMSYEGSIRFVKENFNNDAVLNDMYNPKYMIAENYRYIMAGGEYATYLRKLDYRKKGLSWNNDKYWCRTVEKVASAYRDPIKSRSLFTMMRNSLRYCRSFEELRDYRSVYPAFINTLSDTNRNELNQLFSGTEAALVERQVGRPAPDFTVTDSLGNKYQLKDFKGKVVYLDLWASWCGPCRALTPFFKTLYEQYKSEQRLVCMSVSVGDNMNDWKNALRKDQPTWAQFFDANGEVQKAYVANSIPKFILINKEGNIVSFDAPMPDSSDIKNLLDTEIAR